MNELLAPDKLANMNNSELAKVSSQITGRLSNEDWQNFVLDLQLSGHVHASRENAPLLLQRFLRLEIDLDEELGKRSIAAPLLSNVSMNPERPSKDDQHLVATISSQDAAAALGVEVIPSMNLLDMAFSVRSMLTLRFRLHNLEDEERRHHLELMRRDEGITFLWSKERWERDYLIFIKKDYFTRVYAFSQNLEATARLTNESVGTLVDWLERCWFPRGKNRKRATTQVAEVKPGATDNLKRIVDKLKRETSTGVALTDTATPADAPAPTPPTESAPPESQPPADEDAAKWTW